MVLDFRESNLHVRSIFMTQYFTVLVVISSEKCGLENMISFVRLQNSDTD